MNTSLARFVSPLLAALLSIGLVPVAFAADAAQLAQEADWSHRTEQAAALQADAHQRQAAADAQLAAAELACQEKFLVNRCRDQAKKLHVQATREARRLENEGLQIERAVKREQLADKDRERAEREPARQADLAGRAEQVQRDAERTEAELAAKQAAKERKAEEGARRHAAAAERHQQKQAEHAARVAAKIEAGERKAAAKAAAAGD